MGNYCHHQWNIGRIFDLINDKVSTWHTLPKGFRIKAVVNSLNIFLRSKTDDDVTRNARQLLQDLDQTNHDKTSQIGNWIDGQDLDKQTNLDKTPQIENRIDGCEGNPPPYITGSVKPLFGEIEDYPEQGASTTQGFEQVSAFCTSLSELYNSAKSELDRRAKLLDGREKLLDVREKNLKRSHQQHDCEKAKFFEKYHSVIYLQKCIKRLEEKNAELQENDDNDADSYDELHDKIEDLQQEIDDLERSKEELIDEYDDIIEKKDEEIGKKDNIIAKKNSAIRKKNAEIARLNGVIEQVRGITSG